MKDKFFLIFYLLFSFFIYLISLPFLIFIIFKSKYKKSIPARFFLINNPPFKEKRYHFHTCSLGETRSIKPIVEKLDKVNISVITQTGFEEAKKYKNADVRFLPYEIFLPFWFRDCKSLVVLEAEFWYMLFYMGKKKCNKVVLLNARISEKSFPKYLRFKWFYRKIFENIDVVLAQSEEDKNRLLKLGAKNIKVVGNIKSFFKPKITKKYIKKKPLLVIASTHRDEEEMILKNIPLDKFQVVVVPRHPERFEEVYDIMKNFGKVERLSEKFKMKNEKFKMENGECRMENVEYFTEVELNGNLILGDVMGELINLYAVADVVILGGSFVDNVGGHNPIEAAYFGVPIISGKYYFNQNALYNEVENIYITKISELAKLLDSNLKKSRIKNGVNINEVLNYIV